MPTLPNLHLGAPATCTLRTNESVVTASDVRINAPCATAADHRINAPCTSGADERIKTPCATAADARIKAQCTMGADARIKAPCTAGDDGLPRLSLGRANERTSRHSCTATFATGVGEPLPATEPRLDNVTDDVRGRGGRQRDRIRTTVSTDGAVARGTRRSGHIPASTCVVTSNWRHWGEHTTLAHTTAIPCRRCRCAWLGC